MKQLLSKYLSKLSFILLFFVCCMPYMVYGQGTKNVVLKGVVYAADNREPLIGASLLVSGKDKLGTTTDSDGKFTLSCPIGAEIKISFIGFETLTYVVKKQEKDIKLYLDPSANFVNEVVVTGMSKRAESTFTGNYVTVKGEELRKLSPNNILKGLQYFDPSFKIVEDNKLGADPNAQPEFRMRGDQSLGTGGRKELNSMDLMLDNVSSRPNTPLFVLDGFIVSINRILELDPERVASITILKDAASTAIYGSRAQNGVIVVETKIAADGALQVSYNGSFTIQVPDLTDYHMMSAAEKLDAEIRAGVYPTENITQLNRYNYYLRNVLAGVNTYWLSKPLRTAVQNRHSINASGGTEVFRYNLGANLALNPGVMKGSSNNNKGINFNMTYRRKKITVGANINFSEMTGSNSPYGHFSDYTSINPYYIPTDLQGNYTPEIDNFSAGGESRIVKNPLYNANIGIKDGLSNLTISSNLRVEYQILPNLRLSEQLSYTRGLARTETFKPANHTDFLLETDLSRKGSFRKNSGEMSSWSSNLGLNYNLPLGQHLISLFGNWTIHEDKSNYVVLSARGYPDPHMDDFIFGNKMDTNPSGTEAMSRAMGIVGQLSYSYANKYSLDFNISSEASSRVGSGNRLAPFWSSGFRWNIHNEKFITKKISNLVLRLSYGITGGQNYDPYEAEEFYTFTGTLRPYKSFHGVGATLKRLTNPNLQWSKTSNISIGTELGVWNNRLNISFNYYDNITKNLLTEYDLAPSTGFTSQSINAGELQNKGFDFSCNVIALQNHVKQLYWTFGFNGNKNINKIRKISDKLRAINKKQLQTAGAPLPVLQEGYSTTTLYTVESLGIDPVTGEEVFLGRDGLKTFTWSAADKIPIGDTNPKISGAIHSSINYKALSCSFIFTYRLGGLVYNATLVDKIENSNIQNNLDIRAGQNRWEKPGDVTRYKKVSTANMHTPQSTRFLMTENLLSMSSINLGYRLSKDKFPLLNKLNVENVSFNFTTNDLFRLSTISTERGLFYPFTRSFNFSLSVMFK